MASSKVVQITNIAPQATRDQMQTLFGYLGKIEDIRLYPTIRDVACPVQSRICYVKFLDPACVSVAQHMTNTVFIDRALIVIPFQTAEIPDEQRALELTNNGTLVPGLFPAEPKLPPNVTNQLEGIHPNQVITTHDPRLVANGLPLYPALSATLDATKVEEIRRTLLVTSIDDSVTALQLIDLFSEVAEVKYTKFCNRDGDPERYALVELTDQNSIIAALQLNGKEINGRSVKVYHATQAIAKPQAKSNEAAQREIEEAMSRVKEAQNMISAAIDPVIGLLAKEKKRSRSRGRRSRSPSHSSRRSRRSRSRRHGRSRSRSGSRRSKRSRTRSRERKRKSRSPGHSSRSIRSRSSSRRRSRSRSRRSHSKSKSKPTSSSKSHDKYKDKRDDKKDKKDDKRESKKDDAKDTKGDDKKDDESKRDGSSAEHGGQNGSNKDKDSDKYKDKKHKDKAEKSKDSKDKVSKSKSSRDKSGSRSPSKNRHRSPVTRKSRSPSRKKSPHSRRKSKSPPHSSRNKHSPHKRSRSPAKPSRDDKKKDKDRSHDKESDKERKKKDKKEDKEKDNEKSIPSKVPRNYDEEEEGFDAAERGQTRQETTPSDGDHVEHNATDNPADEKEQDMEISTSP